MVILGEAERAAIVEMAETCEQALVTKAQAESVGYLDGAACSADVAAMASSNAFAVATGAIRFGAAA